MQNRTDTTTTLATTQAFSPAQLAALAYLASYTGPTRDLYALCLRLFFTWCEDHNLDPLKDVRRVHIEMYIRHLQDDRGNAPSTIRGRIAAVKGMYHMACVDGILDRNPAEYAHLPKVHRDDTKFLGLDRLELGTFLHTSRRISPQHAALAYLMGLLGLRVSEACNVQIEDYTDTERGHRVLRVIGKGNKPATIPVTVPVLRVLDDAAGDRTTGPLLVRKKDGAQLDRSSAGWMVKTIAKHAGIRKNVTPHTLRRSAITNALDAGVTLRDAQILARHSDPRTTQLYDVARNQLDRHGVHVLTAYVAGAA